MFSISTSIPFLALNFDIIVDTAVTVLNFGYSRDFCMHWITIVRQLRLDEDRQFVLHADDGGWDQVRETDDLFTSDRRKMADKPPLTAPSLVHLRLLSLVSSFRSSAAPASCLLIDRPAFLPTGESPSCLKCCNTSCTICCLMQVHPKVFAVF